MSYHIVFDCDGTLVDTSSTKYVLYPEIKTILSQLSQVAHLSVWTARDRFSLMRILNENQISQYFLGLYTSDDAYPKPHVKGLQELTLETQKSHVFVVGDSSMDMLGAKNFGALAIGATWNGRSGPGHLLESGADYVATSPQACLSWIMGRIQDT
jgi:phosphoglycolate phosphatase-like HAD superfamily hydrolase